LFYFLKRFFRMAFPAILAKKSFVNILVAIGTAIEFQPGEHLKFLCFPKFDGVAFQAGYFFMFAIQLEFGFIMIEF